MLEAQGQQKLMLHFLNVIYILPEILFLHYFYDSPVFNVLSVSIKNIPSS